MPCLSGLGPADCVIEHWAPALDARAEKAGWRAPCPACGMPRALSIQIKGRQIIWNHHCGCDRQVVSKTLRSRVPCARGRTRKPTADLTELDRLFRSPDIKSLAALRLGGLRALGYTEEEAVQALGLPPRTLRWARQSIAKNRRSAETPRGNVLPLPQPPARGNGLPGTAGQRSA